MTVAPFYTRPPIRWSKVVGWVLLLLICVGVAAYSARYLIDPPRTPQEALGNRYGLPWLVVHVAGSVTALALGAWQFIPRWRKGPVRTHCWIGRVYVVSCLIGAAGGLVLAFGSFAGPVAGVGFGLLAVAWISVNLLGWRAAMKGQMDQHRRWMIRSWAMTLSAVTLRIYLPFLLMSDLPFETGYRVIAYAAWMPNLIVAEAWLRWRKS